MCTWIYIVLCKNSKYNIYSTDETKYIYYIGTTDRLFRRLKEHTIGKGSKITDNNEVLSLYGLYKYDATNILLEKNMKII
jgi:predicted GIY-YIG superfamily endonuclease